ncbi:sigma-54-dependent transcriptional regulator [Sediminibacterium ginsengisoli]|uniref:Two-component system, NtrC family, response regulator HydG n=1 Tax=Sediminibacterium ginsengisoli TaxID=413434 RepID=A0A1T4Q0C3_9BACT|nr:sigma-54 dependent transcriptional regulator [Sediminibacterium ginsengisoli]SJZ97270.1 two-component system, NtrC family, response regulator HydG [Sediminibacterium ginsengisoli]
MHKILIIDDDIDMCMLLERFLKRHDFSVRSAKSGKKGLEEIDTDAPDIILCDFRLEDTDGKDLLLQIKQRLPSVPVIIITGYSDIKVAVDVIKHGAYDYVTKPLLPEEILSTIKNALNRKAASVPEQHIAPQPEAQTQVQKEQQPQRKIKPSSNKHIFGDSREFQTILRQIDLVAPTNYSVIIYGESGSGKEVIASEIHQRSKRKQNPFVAIDCGALSKELAASELFGHEKGSFTGAVGQKIGCLEMANGGTVFLDEIANLSYDIQVALLRVVQERKVRRVGGNKDIELDIRIIVASNELLWEASQKGKFREDLYHRFNEFSINVPPLRERKNDIMTFAYFFLEQTNQELGKQITAFRPEVEEVFLSYSWPGNLRELKNVVKRSTLLSDEGVIDITALPFELVNHHKLAFDRYEASPVTERPAAPPAVTAAPPPVISQPAPQIPDPAIAAPARPVEINGQSLKAVSIDAEYEMIVQALRKANYNKSKAAKLLNVDRKTLYNKMRQYKEFNEE